MIDYQPIKKFYEALAIATGDFIMSDLQNAIKAAQNNKATDLDCVPAKIWKMNCLRKQLL